MPRFNEIWPDSFHLKKLTFFSRWYGKVLNFEEVHGGPGRILIFGYLQESDEASISQAVAVIEEHNTFPLETRSMLWKIAEIKVERQNEWIVFSRTQSDLSTRGLKDLLVDSKNLLEHLRDEEKRLNLSNN